MDASFLVFYCIAKVSDQDSVPADDDENIPSHKKLNCICWEVFLTLLNKYCGKTENASIRPCLQALDRFYEAVMQAILRHINFDGRAAAQLHTLRQEITDSMFMLDIFLFII